MPGKPATRMISVHETMMISPGLRLAVREFDGKRLLVSVGRGGVSLHNPKYDFNDEMAPIGASFFAALVEQELPRG